MECKVNAFSFKNSLILGILFFFLVMAVNVLAQEQRLYRYIDDKGVKVISSIIPSKYVKRGYDIITIDGRLIETVAKELSAEEKIKFLRVQKEKERIEVWDQELLKRYSHPDDIEAAKKRKLLQNTSAIGIVKRNIEKIDEEINRYQSLAAADEREGRDVLEDTLKSIELLKRERNLELVDVEEREKEREQIIEGFDRDIERFKIIRPNQQ